MFDAGDVVHFHYLWKRQADAGEESGRKARPVCVVVRTPDVPGAVFLFAITSQAPHEDRLSLPISRSTAPRNLLPTLSQTPAKKIR